MADEAGEYVSTHCRLGEHRKCQERPIVRCACPCHEPSARQRQT